MFVLKAKHSGGLGTVRIHRPAAVCCQMLSLLNLFLSQWPPTSRTSRKPPLLCQLLFIKKTQSITIFVVFPQMKSHSAFFPLQWPTFLEAGGSGGIVCKLCTTPANLYWAVMDSECRLSKCDKHLQQPSNPPANGSAGAAVHYSAHWQLSAHHRLGHSVCVLLHAAV